MCELARTPRAGRWLPCLSAGWQKEFFAWPPKKKEKGIKKRGWVETKEMCLFLSH